MNIRFRKRIQLLLFILCPLLLTACGTFEVGLEQELPATLPAETVAITVTPSPAEVIEATASPTATIPAPTETITPEPSPLPEELPSLLWATYRNPDSGFGFAYPCHWINQPTILTSYDDAFFMARNIRGHWVDGNPPAGAIKLEIATFDYADSGIEPGTPLEEAVSLAIDDAILATEEVTLGSRNALRVELEGVVYPDDSTNEIYFFQQSPEAMLLLSVTPRDALGSSDVQGLVDSLALSDEEEIAKPSYDPSGPLEGRELYFNEEAGYCFQYPSEYALETYVPSGFPYLGDIVNLKLERPFYTSGLTVTAWRVGEQSTLDELVTNFQNGLPGDSPFELERNPPGVAGSLGYLVGNEPAEYLEGVPGPEGSRDIFMKHEDRLYRLSFIPSVRVNPQAEPDLESLFLVITTSFSFLQLEG